MMADLCWATVLGYAIQMLCLMADAGYVARSHWALAAMGPVRRAGLPEFLLTHPLRVTRINISSNCYLSAAILQGTEVVLACEPGTARRSRSAAERWTKETSHDKVMARVL